VPACAPFVWVTVESYKISFRNATFFIAVTIRRNYLVVFMNSRTFQLADIPLLNGLPEGDLQELASVAQVRALEPNQTLIKAGEIPAFLIFVLEGRLQAHEMSPDGRVIGLGLFSAGEAIGWLSLIDGQPISSTINALEPTHLLLIPMAVAQRLVLTRPLVIERLLKLLAAQIRRGNDEKSMLSLPNAFHRVFVQVNQLSADSQPGKPLDHLPKQHELASIVNTSRETVSRALQMLVKSGVLGKVGHQIVIKESDALQKLASDGPDALPAQK
jgi:CRP-like cAMP-binding protein